MKTTLLRLLTAGALIAQTGLPLYAAVENDAVYNLSLTEILNLNIDVTKEKTTPREAPNIITVITEAEIAGSGARDLIDVLRLVPGFEFGLDILGVVDVGVRGNWGHEGKVLLMLDGQPMNELMFGCNELGNHYPVDQIKQIEIIRGPGSVMYGGWAELAVINIKTKGAKDLDGAAATVTAGQMEGAEGRRNLSVSFGKASGDMEMTAHLFTGTANRSDQNYTSYYGGTYNFAGNNTMEPNLVNVDLKYRGLDVRVIKDEYHTTMRDWWGANLPYPLRTDFFTNIVDIKYDLKPTETLTVTPRFTKKNGWSFRKDGEAAEAILPEGYTELQDLRNETIFTRYTGELLSSWDVTKKVNLLVGAQAYWDEIEYINPQTNGLPPAQQDPTLSQVNPEFGGGYFLRFDNQALYAQAGIDSPIGKITAGGRYDRHSQVGSSFVPRFGITKVFDKLHFKALYAQAFKAPNIDTINTNPRIKPERSEYYEFETGYQFTPHSFLTANLFDITIKDTMIYDSGAGTEGYYNEGTSGTQGAELEYKYVRDWGFADLSYSYYRANKNNVNAYKVPGDDSLALAFPAHKATLNTQYRFSKFSVNPTLIWFSERYAYSGVADFGDPEVLQKYDPAFLANFFLNYTPVRGLTIGAGVYDIFNQKPVFIQPYHDYHTPIPGPSREYIAKLTYDLKF